MLIHHKLTSIVFFFFLLLLALSTGAPGSLDKASNSFGSTESFALDNDQSQEDFTAQTTLDQASKTFDQAKTASELYTLKDTSNPKDTINPENVKFSGNPLDSSPVQTFWCGNSRSQEAGIVILTESGVVYHSVNFGENFSRVSHELFENSSTLDSAFEQIRVKTIVSSPSDPMYFSVMIEKGDLFVTTDCFRSLKKLSPPLPVSRLQYHGSNPSYLLAGSKDCPKNTANNDASAALGAFEVSAESKCKGYTIFASRDHGSTWTIMASNVGQFSWGIVDPITYTPIPQDRIYFIQHSTGKLYYTDTYSKTNVIFI